MNLLYDIIENFIDDWIIELLLNSMVPTKYQYSINGIIYSMDPSLKY